MWINGRYTQYLGHVHRVHVTKYDCLSQLASKSGGRMFHIALDMDDQWCLIQSCSQSGSDLADNCRLIVSSKLRLSPFQRSQAAVLKLFMSLQVSSVSGGTVSGVTSPSSSGYRGLLPNNANTANFGGLPVSASSGGQNLASFSVNGISCSTSA